MLRLSSLSARATSERRSFADGKQLALPAREEDASREREDEALVGFPRLDALDLDDLRLGRLARLTLRIRLLLRDRERSLRALELLAGGDGLHLAEALEVDERDALRLDGARRLGLRLRSDRLAVRDVSEVLRLVDLAFAEGALGVVERLPSLEEICREPSTPRGWSVLADRRRARRRADWEGE